MSKGLHLHDFCGLLDLSISKLGPHFTTLQTKYYKFITNIFAYLVICSYGRTFFYFTIFRKHLMNKDDTILKFSNKKYINNNLFS